MQLFAVMFITWYFFKSVLRKFSERNRCQCSHHVIKEVTFKKKKKSIFKFYPVESFLFKPQKVQPEWCLNHCLDIIRDKTVHISSNSFKVLRVSAEEAQLAWRVTRRPWLDMSLKVPRIPFPLQHFVICLLLNITWHQFRGCSVLSLDHRNWTCHGDTYSSHGDRLLGTFWHIWRFPLHLDCSSVTKATSPDRSTAPGGFSTSQQGETSPTLKSVKHFPFSSGPVMLWFVCFGS